ncbi:MAG: cytochrome c, partial [Planctomycetota bacterium]
MPAARTIRNLSWLLPLAVLAGCGGGAAFSPDGLLLAEARVVAEHRGQLDGVLNTLFGTPDEPAVPAALAEVLDIEQIRHAAGPVESHRVGETIGLYRRHCARCHGLTGDGQGPTALYQSPYPRDFRAGVFKWKSTTRGAAPLDEDLHATLERGIPGTAMPSFRLLKQEERDALVEYVKYLAIRGQTERRLIEHVAEELDYDPDAGPTPPCL